MKKCSLGFLFFFTILFSGFCQEKQSKNNIIVLESTEDFKSLNIIEGQYYCCKRYYKGGRFVNGLNFIGVKLTNESLVNLYADHYGATKIVNKDSYAFLLTNDNLINVLHLGVTNNFEKEGSSRSNSLRLKAALEFIAYFKGNTSNKDGYGLKNGPESFKYQLKKGLFFPAGIYEYNESPNFAIDGLVVRGEGKRNTVLKFKSSTNHTNAFIIDASKSPIYNQKGDKNRLVQGLEFSDFTVEGDSSVTSIIYSVNCVRSKFKNINVREANNKLGVGFFFSFAVANLYENLSCSTDEQCMKTPPNEGVFICPSITRDSSDKSTNNTFINLVVEGTRQHGVRLIGADQNTFIGGTSESIGFKSACTGYQVTGSSYGVTFDQNSKMNTWIGGAFENKDATSDVQDLGFSNKLINCYSSKKVNILKGSKLSTIDGGSYHAIEIEEGSIQPIVKNIAFNHWFSVHGTGRIIDKGIDSYFNNVIDSQNESINGVLAINPAIEVSGSVLHYNYLAKKIYFGSTFNPVSKLMSITNNGAIDLFVTMSVSEGFKLGQSTIHLHPGTHADFEITMLAENMGSKSGKLFLKSATDTVVIDLEGKVTPADRFYIAFDSLVASGTYKNTNSFPVQVVLLGGTISKVTFKRPNDNAVVIGGAGTGLPVNNIFTLMPGDVLEAYYSSAPTAYGIPIVR